MATVAAVPAAGGLSGQGRFWRDRFLMWLNEDGANATATAIQGGHYSL